MMLVTANYLSENIDDPNLILIDTRPSIAYSYGHPKKAQSLTVEKLIKLDKYGSNLAPEDKQAEQIFSHLGIDETKHVVVGGSYMDPSSSRIAWTLQYFGHRKTSLLDSDISLLSKEIEFVRKPFLAKPAKFVPKINSKLRIEANELKEKLNEFVILDARSFPEFASGHLPNAILTPFTDGLGNNGKIFQDASFLENLFAERKITKDSNIVCYCQHGHRAANLLYQLKLAGFQEVRLFDGSFVEWYGRGFPLE